MSRTGLTHKLRSNDVEMPYGIVFTAGTTVPSDGVAGYPKGSMFIATSGTASHTLYLNDGFINSCTFHRVMTASP